MQHVLYVAIIPWSFTVMANLFISACQMFPKNNLHDDSVPTTKPFSESINNESKLLEIFLLGLKILGNIHVSVIFQKVIKN